MSTVFRQRATVCQLNLLNNQASTHQFLTKNDNWCFFPSTPLGYECILGQTDLSLNSATLRSFLPLSLDGRWPQTPL